MGCQIRRLDTLVMGFDQIFHDPAQVLKMCLLRFVEMSRPGIRDAQSAKKDTVTIRDRLTEVRSDARSSGHERVRPEAVVFQRV